MTPLDRKGLYFLLIFSALVVGGLSVVVALVVDQDWSQFVPDTLSSLGVSSLVGVALALVVFRVERSTAKATAEVSAAANWSRVQAVVRLKRPFPPLVGSEGAKVAIRHVTDDLEDWLKGHEDYPIEEWALAAPGQPDLVLIRDLRKAVPALRATSTELDHALRKAYWKGKEKPKGVTIDFGKPTLDVERLVLDEELWNTMSKNELAEHMQVLDDPEVARALLYWHQGLAVVRPKQEELLKYI